MGAGPTSARWSEIKRAEKRLFYYGSGDGDGTLDIDAIGALRKFKGLYMARPVEGVTIDLANAARGYVKLDTNDAFLVARTGVQLVLRSNDADDANGEIGARTVRVVYVRASGALVTETLTMAGATEVPFTFADAIGVNSMDVLTAGSTGANEGTIVAALGSGGAVICSMAGVTGHSTDGVFTVPLGYRLRIPKWGKRSTNGRVQVFLMTDYDPIAGAFVTVGNRGWTLDSSMHVSIVGGLVPGVNGEDDDADGDLIPMLPAKSRVWTEALNASGSAVDVSAWFQPHLLEV